MNRIERVLKINNHILQSSEDVSNYVNENGNIGSCIHVPYMKAINLRNFNGKQFNTENGCIVWLLEDGTLMCEDGYHYNIDCFI